MKRRMLAGGMAVVLSLMMMVSPALAGEESRDETASTEPIASQQTEPTPPAQAPQPDQETPADPEAPATEPEETPAAPEQTSPAPEATVPETTVPQTPGPQEGQDPGGETLTGPLLRQEHVQYMTGFPQGTFQPDTKLTRAQAAQVVYRLLAQPESGTGSCSYTDVPANQWYAQPVRALCALGLFDDGTLFRPNDVITRAEFVDLLVRLQPQAAGESTFPDVSSDYWAAEQIAIAAGQGWIAGYPDGTFRPDNGLTRAEACTVINRMLGRTGDSAQANKLLTLGLYADMTASHWAATTVIEAAMAHTPTAGGSSEAWTGVDLAGMTFTPGFHDVGWQLFYVDRSGKLALNKTFGAFSADSTGSLTKIANSYQMANVPYISQIDNIYAWVGCEAVATLMGLQAKGFATNVSVKYFLDNLPRSSSDPEKGFVGSPYVPDTSKRTRTTIYPAKLAEYSNTYCNGQVVCEDFRGASITDLQRELLAGNCVVGYMTLWWEAPYYRYYNIEGSIQRLVSNNHAVLVCGYDPDKGYFISDPYNYYNRGQVHQYWENAKTFEAIWAERQVGMVLR
ncbi:MAG TPA: S-layer homology domain-containing protein [Candidatus Evtepia faecigallinarum]|nr:S-layer homology domain-containing protein [Candidatus Evtepia faecigallinarum]